MPKPQEPEKSPPEKEPFVEPPFVEEDAGAINVLAPPLPLPPDPTPPRAPYLYEALITFGALIAVMAIGIGVYQVGYPHVLMLIGVLVAALIALKMGYAWQAIELMMYNGIRQALQAIVILAIIGVLIGMWIVSGVVPAMIYYGLAILTPGTYLIATLLITSLTSLATGTSWGTAGTIGVALMGIAAGLGIPLPLAAGAVVSGAYFGDKLSPLSDTTNLSPAMAGTDVFTHIKFMARPTAVAYVISLIYFGVMSTQMQAGAGGDLSAIQEMRSALASSFNLSPLLLLPPIIVIVLIAFKMPAIPGIFIGVLMGGFLAPIMQGADFGSLINIGYEGFVSETGVEAVDSLLSKGGLTSMMYSISLTIVAMMFGGIVEGTKQLELIVTGLLKRVKGAPGLLATTMGTCLVSNATMPEQYISIVVPGRMFAKAYRDRGYHPKMLSNALESSGTVLSPLVPWNTCGAFMVSVLGVATLEYAPYAVFNYVTPIVVFLLAFVGITVARMTSAELAQRDLEDAEIARLAKA